MPFRERGYMDCILRIDLTNGKFTTEKLDEKILEQLKAIDFQIYLLKKGFNEVKSQKKYIL